MKNVFKGIDYYSIVGLVPMWVRNDGHSQEGCLSKEDFETLVQAMIMNSLIGFCIIMIAKC